MSQVFCHDFIEISIPDVCKLRLDFESFTIQGTGNTVEVDTAAGTAGGQCLDTFDVTVSFMKISSTLNTKYMSLLFLQTNTGQRIPTICGQNTGQHSEFKHYIFRRK